MFNNQPERVRLTPQAIVGIVIIVYGLLLTGGNLGWFDPGHFVSFWPLALIGIGGAMYSRAPDAPSRLSAVFVMAAGAVLTIARLAGWHVTVRLIWPLLLVALGAVLIARALGTATGSAVPGRLDQRASLFAFWSGSKRRITSAAFQYADCTAVMGGIEIDLSGAGTSGAEAIIDVFVMMGGINIRVPADWVVSNQVLAVMGGVDDRSTGPPDSRNRLILRGFVMMGGIEVKT